MAASALLAALWLLATGGQLVNRANPMGGPMNLDLSNPLGALSLLCGVAVAALLPSAWQRIGWVLSGIAAAVPVTWNVWRYPPFLDGAGYAAWSGVPDPGEWPPGASWTMLGLSPPALALALAVAGPPWRRRRWPTLGAAAAATVATCWAYGALIDARYLPAFRPSLMATLTACGVPVALAIRHPRHPAALVAGAYALVLPCLLLATLWVGGMLP